MSWLPAPLALRLELEAPALRALVTGLCSPKAATRLRALDAVHRHLLEGSRSTPTAEARGAEARGADALSADAVGADPLSAETAGDGSVHAPRAHGRATLAAGAEAALPYVLALATAPRYPGAAVLLTRVAQLCAAIDDPPRSLAGRAGSEAAGRVFELVGASVGSLVALARSSADPQAARLAIGVCARHPDHDAEVEPVLLALVSGAKDDEEQARLLYALTRIQAARGATFHRRIAEARNAMDATPQRLAVALALLDEDPPEPERSLARALVQAAPPGASDPRAFGRRLALDGE